MSTLITLFIILIVVASIAMILVVLVQKSKGGGLSSSFSGTNAILGYKKTTDTVEKITWILATFIIVLCIAAVSLAPKSVVKPAISTPVQQEQPLPDMTDQAPLSIPQNDGAN